ncbi:hypothetical protein [Chrysiogenes arsenatis]|uniref:hypothetical protein n=1 Tax=Chrysiogenes arsenatis TaxID=309797 RepID=UPI001F3F25F5|nr:hypothetical protein [Chrysiogenes arsenatis]
MYRFSTLQDTMGAKLFKPAFLYLGENIDKPFIDILKQLEHIDILSVDEWFEIRDLRNEIARNYEANESVIIKRGLYDDIETLRIMKDLRNTIAYEYIVEDLVEVFEEVLRYTKTLTEIIRRTLSYIQIHLQS